MDDLKEEQSAPDKPIAFKLKSLRQAYVTPGDVIFVPSGAAVLEKTVNGTSIVARCTTLLMSSTGLQRVAQLCAWCPGTLGVTEYVGNSQSFSPVKPCLADGTHESFQLQVQTRRLPWPNYARLPRATHDYQQHPPPGSCGRERTAGVNVKLPGSSSIHRGSMKS